MKPRVILADDHVMVPEGLGRLLGESVELVACVNDGKQLVESARKLRPDIIVSDLTMPVMSGLDAMKELKADGSRARFIFLSRFFLAANPYFPRVPTVGHHDARPSLHCYLLTVREVRLMKHELAIPFPNRHGEASSIEEISPDAAILGASDELKSVMHQVQQVAPTAATVLLLGETGTGKALVARAIHQRSPRRHRRFVVVDRGTLPATLIESELFGHERGAFTGAVSNGRPMMPRISDDRQRADLDPAARKTT